LDPKSKPGKIRKKSSSTINIFTNMLIEKPIMHDPEIIEIGDIYQKIDKKKIRKADKTLKIAAKTMSVIKS